MMTVVKVSSGHDRIAVLGNSQKLQLHAKSFSGSEESKFHHGKGIHETLPLPKELLPVDGTYLLHGRLPVLQ